MLERVVRGEVLSARAGLQDGVQRQGILIHTYATQNLLHHPDDLVGEGQHLV